ncbi:hypothetical protein GCM10009037_29390 [Halarchaeum grantii]|uniref:Uncharacterized protein n=1 Tax=Halarchaeum grantii TaxID=1193105 RepID=A0A830FG97_9EURY|nr:hypothetical protein [Halarchaeum grantii]GGL44100.1 hypothetical protein GCM10009037_29390 [Halarchaeum grantii]
MCEETSHTANLVQKGIRRAIEVVDADVEKLKEGEKTSWPELDSWSVVDDKRSASFNDDHATLSTSNGRVTAEYMFTPDDEHEGTPFTRYYEIETGMRRVPRSNTTSMTTRSTCMSR